MGPYRTLADPNEPENMPVPDDFIWFNKDQGVRASYIAKILLFEAFAVAICTDGSSIRLPLEDGKRVSELLRQR